MAGNHSKAAADQSRDLLEARLCNKAQIYALQDKSIGLMRSERKEVIAAFGSACKACVNGLGDASP